MLGGGAPYIPAIMSECCCLSGRVESTYAQVACDADTALGAYKGQA
jgi:hypothetical protein